MKQLIDILNKLAREKEYPLRVCVLCGITNRKEEGQHGWYLVEEGKDDVVCAECYHQCAITEIKRRIRIRRR